MNFLPFRSTLLIVRTFYDNYNRSNERGFLRIYSSKYVFYMFNMVIFWKIVDQAFFRSYDKKNNLKILNVFKNHVSSFSNLKYNNLSFFFSKCDFFILNISVKSYLLYIVLIFYVVLINHVKFYLDVIFQTFACKKLKLTFFLNNK